MTKSLYDKLAHVLRDVHERFPDDGFEKHQRLRGLLSDHLPEAEREIRITLDAVDEGVVAVISDTPDAERGLQIDRLVTRLDTSRGIREDIARQIVQAFVFALGKGDLPSSVGVAMPPTPEPQAPDAGGDDWVGVSEAVGADTTPAEEVTVPLQQTDAGGKESWKDKIQSDGFKKVLAVAGIAVALLLFWPSSEPPPQQGGQPQPSQPSGPGPQSGGQPQPNQPQVGPTDGLPRVGPGAQPNQPQVGPTDGLPRVGPGAQPDVQGGGGGAGASGSATWYDDEGLVWSIQYSGTEFQGTAEFEGAPIGIVGIGNPQTGQFEFQVFDHTGTILGYGQAYFADQSHINYRVVDDQGSVIAEGQFHINHRPGG